MSRDSGNLNKIQLASRDATSGMALHKHAEFQDGIVLHTKHPACRIEVFPSTFKIFHRFSLEYVLYILLYGCYGTLNARQGCLISNSKKIMWKIISAMTGILTLGSFVQGAELQPEWTSFKLSDQGQMELSFSAHSGQTYVIEASEDLAFWQAVSDPIVASDAATNWIAPEEGASQQFYRLAQFDRSQMRAQFEQNRKLWNEQALSSYQYVFNWSCFCLPEYTEPVNIKVESGEWTDISLVRDGAPVNEKDWERYKTIEELFDIIDEAFHQDAKEISVEYDPDLGYPTSVFIDYDERIADEERGFNVTLETQPSIQLMAQIPDAAASDAFRLLEANVSGDLLEIEVEYGGGCREHLFEIVANPNAFLESDPLQANIYMTHESNNDPCKAFVREKLTFSLRPLKEAFRALYPNANSLTLNIHGFRSDGGGTVLTVPYEPSQVGQNAMRAQLDRNRQLWNEQALSDYQYVFNWSCFCLPEYTAPVNIKVERGEWTEISSVGDGLPVSEKDWRRYKTIEELFDIIDEALLRDAKEISVEYDSDLGYPTSVFIDYDERIADEERGFNVTLETQPSIQLMAQIPDAAASDAFRLLEANVSGDLLEIEVEYGGGCREHLFEIIAAPTFLESWPVQANIYMTHESNDDLCRALVRKKLTFSLQPLKEAFQRLYPKNDSLILNIHRFRSDGAETSLTVPFTITQQN